MKFTNTDCVGKVVSCELDSQVEGKMDYWEWWRVLDYFFSFTVYEQVEKQVRVQVLNQVYRQINPIRKKSKRNSINDIY